MKSQIVFSMIGGEDAWSDTSVIPRSVRRIIEHLDALPFPKLYSCTRPLILAMGYQSNHIQHYVKHPALEGYRCSGSGKYGTMWGSKKTIAAYKAQHKQKEKK